jgi:hypothetical protein
MREHQHIDRTAHLLALMKKGDDAFNARDFAAVDAIHHPDIGGVGRAPGTESLDCDKLPLFPVRIKPASGDAMIIGRLSVDSDISPRVELREVSERER